MVSLGPELERYFPHNFSIYCPLCQMPTPKIDIQNIWQVVSNQKCYQPQYYNIALDVSCCDRHNLFQWLDCGEVPEVLKARLRQCFFIKWYRGHEWKIEHVINACMHGTSHWFHRWEFFLLTEDKGQKRFQHATPSNFFKYTLKKTT